MKLLSLEELYKKVMSSGELKKEYFEAAKEGRIAEFLGEHDCGATLEELQDFLTSPKVLPQGEIADDELDAVAGGTCYYGGKKVVTPVSSCDDWVCGECGTSTTMTVHSMLASMSGLKEECSQCHCKAICMNCRYCHYEKGMTLCYCPNQNKR